MEQAVDNASYMENFQPIDDKEQEIILAANPGKAGDCLKGGDKLCLYLEIKKV